MDLHSDRRIAPLLVLLLLFVPLNIYVIGDWLGTGVQWALFRYQETTYGASLITVASDIGYVSSGLIAGKTAISFLLWDVGAVILLVSFFALLLVMVEREREWIHYAGLAIAASGVLFLASCIAQYGPTFAGPAGFAVPLGVPLVFAVGWLVFVQKSGGEEDRDDDKEEDTEADTGE
ncbi:MAG: hypothetical protein NQU46_09280 [Methanolinea sp.]|nr:hypothetical protein [Methanolinea sp.]